MEIAELKNMIFILEDEMAKEIESISDYIFRHPELGREEYLSSKFLVDTLAKYGFDILYPYYSDIPTSFRAEIGKNEGPKFAFLAEYDALPGMGVDGKPGHACGHNWIAATAVGSGIVLSRIIEYLPGKIVIFGTPAEETVGYKVNMVERGGFDDIDGVLQLHLGEMNTLETSTLAIDSLQFDFIGKAAHAASNPYNGINALDAVNLTYAGINALRQHVKSDVRIHGIITEGGKAPNIVPDYGSCKFYIRANQRKYLNEVTEKVINCAKGAALMTGAELKISRFENSYNNLMVNPILSLVAKENLEAAGFQDFKKAEDFQAGSSDIGNVSHVVPTAYGNIDIGLNVQAHQKEFAENANGPEAMKRLHMAVKGMACTALDVILQPGLLAKIKASFNQYAK